MYMYMYMFVCVHVLNLHYLFDTPDSPRSRIMKYPILLKEVKKKVMQSCTQLHAVRVNVYHYNIIIQSLALGMTIHCVRVVKWKYR